MIKNQTLEDKALSIAKELVTTYGATSIQYALIDNGNIILSGSSGVYDKKENKPIEKNNMYGIGSLSKLYVSAAVMMLVDKGLIDIDKPLINYISEFNMLDERYKEITPRMLMNHSSGIYGTHFSHVLMFDNSDTTAHDTLLLNLQKQGLKTNPGELSEYCNDGFTLLEILVERISGISYTKFIDKYICKPLGIKNTKTPLDSFNRDMLVKAYMPMYEGALPVESLNMLGSGGLYSTAEDVCKFSEVLMGKKTDILSATSALAMQNNEIKNGMSVDDEESFFTYGLGWDIVNSYPFADYDIKALVKGGDTILFHGILVSIPEHNMAMSVLASGITSMHNFVFACTILEELLEKKGIIKSIKPIKPLVKPIKYKMPKDIEKYAGTYATTTTHMIIEPKDGELKLPMLSSGFFPIPEQTYFYTSDNTFKNSQGDIELKFVQRYDNNVYLQVKAIIKFAKVGEIVFTFYCSQKLMPSTLSQSLVDVWKKRAGKLYYIVSEKPTSQLYFIGGDTIRIKLNDDFTNSFIYGGTQIINDTCAINTLKFRDTIDISFYTKDGVEYLKANDVTYMGEDDIPELCNGENYICTIEASGFSKYYKIGKKIQGKIIQVDIPKNAAYVVYDDKGLCINFTTVSKNNKTVLPKDGLIAFIGKPKDVFRFTLENIVTS